MAYTTIQALSVYGGTGVIDADPLFVDPASGDYRLGCNTLCIDAGDQTRPELTDAFDLDQDTDDTDTVPDLELTERIIGPEVDLGCYEYPCDLDLDLDGDTKVSFNDLLRVLSAWGPCSGECPEDFDGNGEVDFNDLLAVLDGWCLGPPLEDVVVCMGMVWPDDWNLLESCLQAGTTVQQENCACWIDHYYYCHCRGTCVGAPSCPGADPLGHH